MDAQESNVIVFPIQNKRFDLNKVEVDQDKIAENIKLIKLTYFSDIAEEILDHVVRSISVIGFNSEEQDGIITSTDIILLKESIIALMCKINGLEHPLHKIAVDNIIISRIEDDEEMFKYTFKKEEEI